MEEGGVLCLDPALEVEADRGSVPLPALTEGDECLLLAEAEVDDESLCCVDEEGGGGLHPVR
jgi:hypothetical protein